MAVNVIEKLNKIALWHKALGVLVAAVLILGMFFFMSWSRLDTEKAQINLKLVDLEKKYEEQKAVADNLITFKTNAKKLEDDLKAALTQLPQDKEVPSLVRDIYTLGRKSGITFKTFQPMPEAPKEMYTEIPIKLALSGSFHEVAVFFDRIGKLTRIVNISELGLALASATKVESNINVTVDCIATTYAFSGGPVGGGSASPTTPAPTPGAAPTGGAPK